MKTRNKLGLVGLALLGALALGNGSCGPKTMSIERALNEAKIMYVSNTGKILTDMDAMEAYANDFESNSVGNRNLYFPNVHFQLKEGMKIDNISKYNEGYELTFVNKDTAESQTIYFKGK